LASLAFAGSRRRRPQNSTGISARRSRPPITLAAMAAGTKKPEDNSKKRNAGWLYCALPGHLPHDRVLVVILGYHYQHMIMILRAGKVDLAG
jgi:hypothetical protein